MANVVNNIAPIENIETQELPWLIFTLHKNAYAVNSKYVNGILMPPEITPLPEASNIYKGLVDIRGEVFPLLEVRRLFRFQTIEEECNAFDTMLNGFKETHLGWMKELKRCVSEKDIFMMATDPQKCAFGTWYYEYISKNNNAGTVSLRKIEEPHRLLHETATKVISLVRDNTDNKNSSEIERLLQVATEQYVPVILSLLEEAKQFYRNSYRETVVTLSNGEETLGLIVDEVLAIDKIQKVCDDRSMHKIVDSRYFVGVGHNEKIKKEILIVDEEMLLKKAKI